MANPLAADLDHILAHTAGLWDELRGQRIFITGGTGFFGCWLLESFAWANDKLELDATAMVLTRNPEAFRDKLPHLTGHPAVKLYPGDVRSFEFPAGSFSHVIHAASETSAGPNAEDPLLVFDTIVQGTRHTLEFARHCGASKCLLTSSGAVYGKQPPDMTHIAEDYLGAPYPTDARSAYGEGKRAAELLCTLFAHRYGLETKIARGFAFVGPYMSLDARYAMGNFIRDALQGGPIEVRGDGTPYRSYLYSADLAIWLWTNLFRGQACRPYNIGSEAAVTIKTLAYAVADVFDPRPEVHVLKKPEAGKLAGRYVPSTRRAGKELALNQYIDLPEAIKRTVVFEQMRSR